MSNIATTRKPRKPVGRVDVLAERILETVVTQSKHSLLQDLFEATRPGVKQLLRETVGPRTKRGRQITENLFAAKDAMERVKEARAKRQARA